MSNSSWSPKLQHAKLPCPSSSAGVCSNSYPLSQRCHPTISSSVASFSPALKLPHIQVFSNESPLFIRWPKYWSPSFSNGTSNEYSGLISFRTDWFDLLAVQGSLKSLLQHHSLRASVLCHSAFFMDQLSHPYMTTGRTIALTLWTFVCKAMSLLFNILSRFVIAFLLRSKSLLISWLQSLLPMILEPKKIRSVILEHEKRNLRHGLIINSAAIHYEALWYRVLHVKNNCIINSNITEGNSLVSWVLVSYIYRHCPNPVGIFDKQKLSDKQCYWGPVPFQHQPHTSHIIRTDDRNNLSQHHCRSSKGNITLWY